MSEKQNYYDLADQAADHGEVSFLKFCVDEILKRSCGEAFVPNYARLFKTLYEARLHFLHLHTDRGPKALLESIPGDVLQKLRDLDDLTALVTAFSEGQPITESILKINRTSTHPIRPVKP